MILKINKHGEEIATVEIIETESGAYMAKSSGTKKVYDEGMQQGEFGFSQCFEIDLEE